jgi:hypothetical protein
MFLRRFYFSYRQTLALLRTAVVKLATQSGHALNGENGLTDDR